MRSAMFLLLLPLGGCSLLGALTDKLEQYTETTTMQGLALNVAEPQNDQIANVLAELADWSPGIGRATIFLADASNADDMSEAPIGGAAVTLRAESFGELTLDEGKTGYYETEDLDYPQGEELEVVIEGESTHRAATLAPAGLKNLEIPERSAMNQSIVIDASHEDIDALFVVVVEVRTATVIYDSTPKTIEAMYEFSHGAAPTSVELDGSMFDRAGLYAIGLSGLIRAEQGTYEELNVLLSTFMAGEVVFSPVLIEG